MARAQSKLTDLPILFRLPLEPNNAYNMNHEPEIELLKSNFRRVEEKFINYFEKGKPRWPQESRDFLRNHHKNLDNFSPRNITLEKLGLNDLPENILHEIAAAFEAFKKGEAYN
jgi:hypothetical protein